MQKSAIRIARYNAVLLGGSEWGQYSHQLKPLSASYFINSPVALALLATWREPMIRCSLSSDCTHLLVLENDVYFLENFQVKLIEAVSISRERKFELLHIGINCIAP
jgi:hypothetical protein